MPATTTVLLFALATFVLTVSPGPGVLYVVTRTLSQGRKAGLASMFGIESGEVVWLAAAATGLAAVLSASASALTLLRWAGAAYLIFLGVQRWRKAEVVEAPSPARLASVFGQGLITQILNPKVAVFFVAFLPQFLNPARPIAPQVALLGVIYVAIAIAVDAAYVLSAAAVSRRFIESRWARRRMNRVSAATYAVLGVAAIAIGSKKA